MQIGNVTNQYINNYHYQNIQQVNQQKETRAAEKLTEQQLLEYNQQLYREQQRWLAFIMMMQFFANNRMWSLFNQIFNSLENFVYELRGLTNGVMVERCSMPFSSVIQMD